MLYALVNYRNDYFLLALLGLIVLLFLGSYRHCHRTRRETVLFRNSLLLALLAASLSFGVYALRMPRGLSGRYYERADWQGDPADTLRYFERPGQRTDRVLDFNPNDFRDRYPFSNKSFGIIWQGFVYVPDEEAILSVDSNFAVWMYLDDTLVQAPASRIDMGTPEARAWLREGWSHDEIDASQDEHLNFAWSSAPQSTLYLGKADPLAEGDYRLTIRCKPFVYPGSSAQTMTVTVEELEIGQIALQEGWHTYTLPVSSSLLQQIGAGQFAIHFTYAFTARPADVLGIPDGRNLAVAFDHVALEPVFASQIATPTSPPAISRGLHRLTLKVQRLEENPGLRLLWNQGQGRPCVVSEDMLFPFELTPDSFHQGLLLERIMLIAVMLLKIAVIAWLLWLTVRTAGPNWIQALCNRENWGLIAIGALACGLRLILLWQKQRYDPAFSLLTPGTDHLGYIFFARGFWRGYWPGLSHQPFYFNPLVPFYAIACATLFGESLFTLRMVTACLSSLTVMLVFALARRAFNRPVAYIAALLCACNGVLMFYDTSLLVAPLFTFLSVLALWLIERLREERTVKYAIAIGGVIGLAAFGRTSIFLLFPLLFIWMLMVFPGRLRRNVALFCIVCLAAALTILPVTLRNYYSNAKRPVVLLTTNSGMNLWMGNTPSSTGTYGFSHALLREARERMKRTGTSYLDEVWRYIKTQPLDYLKLEYTKLKLFWRGYEIPNLITYHFHQEHFLPFLRFPWLNFLLIGPAGLVGMALALRQWKRGFMLYGMVGIHVLTVLLVMMLARYRIPVVPILSIFAAYTIWWLFRAAQTQQWRRMIIVLGICLALYLMFNYPYAASMYQARYGEVMPLTRMARYWDMFFHVP